MGQWRPSNAMEAEETARKKLRAVELYLGYMSQRKIAAELGVSQATITRWLKSDLLNLVPVQDIEEVRQREVDQLDKLALSAENLIRTMAQTNDFRIAQEDPPLYGPEDFIKVQDHLLRVQDRRAKLLGLNKPVLVSHVHKITTEMDEEIESLVAELTGGGKVVTNPDEVDEAVYE